MFDGDEMNLHMPQSVTTATELQELAGVSSQIISPRECKPIISVVQDIALGIFRLTKNNVYVSDKQMMNLMSTNLKFDGTVPKPAYNKDGVQKWTGRQALSTIIPKNISVKPPKVDANNKNVLIIENGEIIQGTVDKGMYQSRTKGLVHSIVNECGAEEARLFFDNTQKLICNWLVNAGFSVGISDLIVDDETKTDLAATIHDMKVKVYDMIKNIHLGKFDNKSINSNSEYFEDEVNNILNQAREAVGKKALAKIDDNVNRMINMVKSGSKGSILNVSQMVACLGQQNVEGKRIAYGFDDRTLPHYVRYDDGPDSRGFVENSFIKGLSPQEFFFHAMGGREGLIDTAVKSVTADTRIVIIENGVSKSVKIGEWIDGQMQKLKDKVKHYPEDFNMEALYLEDHVIMPTIDIMGKSSWGVVKAITRHDSGTKVYEITTKSGRSVKVSESNSLLIWNAATKQLNPMNTPDVKIGDITPVMANISKPPTTKQYFDMQEYFPKDKYIHGTEYNKAVKMMKEAQSNKFRIQSGWWEKNNGTSFITPYPSKARLQRATVRSNNENIYDSCIYPFRAMRERAIIPDKFELNYDNGVFIGIYLADGNTDTPAGSVQISKKDPDVQKFTRDWFDKYNITHRTIVQEKKIGTSYGVIGSSTLLCRFLDKFVGVGARNKYVPDIAFSAPDEFVKGILSGYFSGDGSVSKYDITANSTSRRLIEGIAALCARFEIFGTFTTYQLEKNNLGTINIAPIHRLTIKKEYAERFASEIDLVMKEKNDKLYDNRFERSTTVFEQQNDTILDEIIDIKIHDANLYPKLYDVSIPETERFVIANGIGQKNTSETGYLNIGG